MSGGSVPPKDIRDDLVAVRLSSGSVSCLECGRFTVYFESAEEEMQAAQVLAEHLWIVHEGHRPD